MIYRNYTFPLRLLCLLLVFLILAYSVIIPVHASALLYEVVAATARSLVASLIRALGIYVSDGIQSSLSDGLTAWESLVDMIVAKLPVEYLAVNAAGEYIVDMIFQDGIYYADRNLIKCILQYLTNDTLLLTDASGDHVVPIGYGYPDMEQWQVNEINSILTDLESDGYYYSSYLRHLPYCTYIDISNSDEDAVYYDTLVVFSESEPTTAYMSGSKLVINFPAGHCIYLYRNLNGNARGTYRSRSDPSYTYRMNANGATIMRYNAEVTVQVHGGFGGTIDSIKADSIPVAPESSWDSRSVTVTTSQGATVVGLPVSVPSDDSKDTAVAPWGDVTSGTEVNTGAESVPGTGTQTKPDIGTDAESQTGFWSSVLSWLGSLWDVLSQILSGVLAIPIAIAKAISTAIADVISAIKSLAPDPPSFSDLQIPSLQDFFPFCIPFDLLDMMRALNASPVAPSFTFACPLPGGGVYYVNIDLSAWNSVAATIRSVTMAIYVVALANSTRKFIKW